MSWFEFWYRLEKWSYRFAKYCHAKRDEAFDRDIDNERRRLERMKRK